MVTEFGVDMAFRRSIRIWTVPQINQSNREFQSGYTIIIDIRAITLHFLWHWYGHIAVLKHNKVTIERLSTQQQLTNRSQET